MVEGRPRSFKISKKANKFLESLPEKQRKSVRKAIQRLIDNDLAGLDIKRLLPYPHEFRLRIGKVRILFRSTKDLLFIFKAHHRSQAYKR